MCSVISSLQSALTEQRPTWPEQIAIVAAVGVAADSSTLDTIKSIGCEAIAGLELGPRGRAFDPNSEVFETAADMVVAKDLFTAIGSALGAQPPLGFKNQGLLAVFESNCPNNTLPVLWRSGQYAGRTWHALFDRMR